MPSEPTVDEVRELLTRAELCLNDGVSWAGPSIEIVAALCRHFLASPMTAGEFAGLLAQTFESMAIRIRESARKAVNTEVACALDCDADSHEAAASVVRELASQHNITIVEPTNDRS